LVPGVISWYGFHIGGVHPALALIPVIPTMPHAKRDIGLFREEEGQRLDTLNAFEHWWRNPVELILGAFGLVNAGVALGSAGSATWLVLGALLIGKPVGITLFALLGRRCGLALPREMNVKDVIVIGTGAGVGFTVALFVSGVAFANMPDAKDAASMGALGSFAGMFLTVIVARLLKVKKTTN
ncbi:MAG: Na+/H+ antiporter NhaA, partial [Planctomycetaceae bacterium]